MTQKRLIAHYKFNDAANVGKDYSGNAMDAVAMGSNPPSIKEVNGKTALNLSGGVSGTSYMKLPETLLGSVSDDAGVTITAWINLSRGSNVWERIVDLGKGASGPYLFLTRGLRGVCYNGTDIACDPAKALPEGQWIHIALSVSGTKCGTLSSAGPIVYINGEVAADGSISQTTSGMYGKYRNWFETFKTPGNYVNNFIGKSQYDVDGDFTGSISDMQIYADALTSDEIIELMCDSLTNEDIVSLAKNKYLPELSNIATNDLALPTTLMGGKVSVNWTSSNPSAISNDGKILPVTAPEAVTLTATIVKDNINTESSFDITVLPKDTPAYTVCVNANDETVDISETLWGLFYEDINNAADGGIYAELIQNRSFEAFTFDTYDARSGKNAKSTGRNRNPLFAWFGDTDKMEPKCEGGLNEYFNIDKPDTNNYYVEVKDGAVIYNKGFCDNNHACSIFLTAGEKYDFTIWAKANAAASLKITLVDDNDAAVSDSATIDFTTNTWNKYGVDEKIILTATKTGLFQLKMEFTGDVCIDMVSLFPEAVWGANEEELSKTAHKNYLGNKNYRLRSDLVKALVDLHPTFLRFPGGCISEGSYIWENVYDWKDSVGDVELRTENFNVWGYMMTMGLGYMEYFQLAEDLNATPLPVMACGVLCQARSGYANPAGGALQDKYIKNFTDLIDFAINTDFDNNEWAALRKSMGHEAPFDLHYLGVGNENWGPEFMASFEIFYERITQYVKKNYPGYKLDIISTVGAQADDDAYKYGWEYLFGARKGSAKVAFTDGNESFEEDVTWYKYQSDFMETIADEHYYRPNQYLLNNVDRYNYYYRAYNADGSVNEDKISKVFVGEYASSDKNTLAGAIAEAAIMTSYENNSDVIRLAATAPLFNKVLTDSTYRWTPDCIWFDNDSVWYTPTYYVQQLFAKYIGKKAVSTTFSTYENGKEINLIPSGGVEIASGTATILVKNAKITSNTNKEVLADIDFKNGMPEGFDFINGSNNIEFTSEGMLLKASNEGANGIYCINKNWTNYTITVNAIKQSGNDGFYVGVGVTDMTIEGKNILEYGVGFDGDTTGLKVFKKGIEGYKLGDFSSSKCAGNLRSAMLEEVKENTEYVITVNYGGTSGKNIICDYKAVDGSFASQELNYKLEAYNSDVFTSVTKDDKNLYMKLVNADEYDKPTKIVVNSANVSGVAKIVTITADKKFAHTANVNEKNNEVVVPVESEITFTNNEAVITLPANSVVAVIANI